METPDQIPSSQIVGLRLRAAGFALVLALGVVVVSGAVQLSDVGWMGAGPLRSVDLVSDADMADVILPRDLEIHPDQVYRRFLSTRAEVADMRTIETVRRFQDLLSLFSLRQSTDDNFTMRVIDSRTGGLLELFELDSLRLAHGVAPLEWPEIDRIRRRTTSQLVDRHEDEGVPREFITVKWGRRNQVLEARAREAAFIEHEINLARMLGLSLLATEIGTVETFNDDRVVSRVGARSRYQLMPSTLRDLGVIRYPLETATGRRVNVREEWHPLISLEASFIIARAYSNAMGHEIPGLSAYHTGPYNVFNIYREYLNTDTTRFTGNSNVVEAYQWGLTDGFGDVSAHTSFGVQSRGYLPSLYGAMKATETIPIDTSLTVLVERVSLREGEELLLSQLLDSIAVHAPDLPWRTAPDDTTLYMQFRRLNPHIDLPSAEGTVGVPVAGNLRIVSDYRGNPVRFFVPAGTVDRLAAADFMPFDETQTVRYDHSTLLPQNQRILRVDVEYDNLVASIRHFGFTESNRSALDSIYVEMRRAQDRDPSYYRKLASEVTRLHRWVWRSRHFTELAEDVDRARARVTIPAMRPAPTPAIIGAKPLRELSRELSRGLSRELSPELPGPRAADLR